MNQQSFSPSERQSKSKLTEEREFRWWWVILAPYLVLSVSIAGLVLFGNTEAGGPVRSLLALGLLLGAGLVHLGLYKDAHHLRTTGSGWMPYYRWYAVGGAVVLLGALLVVDVTAPGSILGGILLSAALGVYITAPLYLGRRYLNTRQQRLGGTVCAVL